MISYQFQPGEHLDLMPTCPNCLSLYIVFRSRPLVPYVINNPSDVSDNHTNDEMSAMLGVWISKCMVWWIKRLSSLCEWMSLLLSPCWGTLTCGAFTSLCPEWSCTQQEWGAHSYLFLCMAPPMPTHHIGDVYSDWTLSSHHLLAFLRPLW